MARASNRSPDEKLRVVLSVLRGELSAGEAARRAGVSEQSVHNWKKTFLESGRDGLAKGAGRRSGRELELEAENDELKAALGEAYVQLRVWKKGAEYLPPSRTRVDPHRSPDAHLEVRGADRCAAPHLPPSAGSVPGW